MDNKHIHIAELDRQERKFYDKRVRFHYDILTSRYLSSCFEYTLLITAKVVAHDLAIVDLRKRRKKMKRIMYEQ